MKAQMMERRRRSEWMTLKEYTALERKLQGPTAKISRELLVDFLLKDLTRKDYKKTVDKIRNRKANKVAAASRRKNRLRAA